MAVAYIDPAERAWSRTRRLLFQPVDVEKWLVIGFAAFLAGLAGEWGGFDFSSRWSFDFPPDFGAVFHPSLSGFRDVLGGPGWMFVGLPFLLCLPVMIALLWVGSRGKLVFLDDVARDRSAIVEPWKRLGRLGDSLFLWRAGFYLMLLILFAGMLGPVIALSRRWSSGIGESIGAIVGLGAMLGILILGIAAAFVALMLESFVIPLMYRDGIGVMDAWRRFVPLLRAHLPEFVAYGLLILVAGVCVALGLLALSLLTCCVGFLLLALPYVRSVVLLPVSCLFRLYSLEFLAQFGPEYAIAPPDEPAATPPPSATPSAASPTAPVPTGEGLPPSGDEASPPDQPEPPGQTGR